MANTREPPLSQMLEDPMTQVLMLSDGVDPRELQTILDEARRRIARAAHDHGKDESR